MGTAQHLQLSDQNDSIGWPAGSSLAATTAAAQQAHLDISSKIVGTASKNDGKKVAIAAVNGKLPSCRGNLSR